jgi:hypothetical protein
LSIFPWIYSSHDDDDDDDEHHGEYPWQYQTGDKFVTELLINHSSEFNILTAIKIIKGHLLRHSQVTCFSGKSRNFILKVKSCESLFHTKKFDTLLQQEKTQNSNASN